MSRAGREGRTQGSGGQGCERDSAGRELEGLGRAGRVPPTEGGGVACRSWEGSMEIRSIIPL